MAGIAAHLPKSSRGPVARNSARTGHAEESARGATRRGAARRISGRDAFLVSPVGQRKILSRLPDENSRTLSLSLSPTAECYRFKTGYPKHEFSARPGGWKGDEGGRREKQGETERVVRAAPYVCASVGEKATTSDEYAARRTREKRPLIRCPSAERKWLRFARHVRRGERKGERDSVWGERVTRARAARATSRGNERAVRVSASD